MTAFFAEISDFLGQNKDDSPLAPYLAPAKTALDQLRQATKWLVENTKLNLENVGAASTDYLHLFGLTALAFMWARMAKAVLARQAAETSTPSSMRNSRSRNSSVIACSRKRAHIWPS